MYLHRTPNVGVILGIVVSKSQWHHYLPQVYLKGFTTPTGEVWRYDRVDGALKPLGTLSLEASVTYTR
jgi:hypothetical protein